jgi:predicted AAA+ superfamily ATPase
MLLTQQSGGFQSLQKALWALRRLTLFRSALGMPAVSQMQQLLELIAVPGTGANRSASIGIFHDIYHTLSTLADSFIYRLTPDPWKELILEIAVFTRTLFSETAERCPFDEFPEDLATAARHDLGLLGDLYKLDMKALQLAIMQSCPGLPRNADVLPSWSRLMKPGEARQGSGAAGSPEAAVLEIKQYLDSAQSWADAVPFMAGWHFANGSGEAAKYWIFKWSRGSLKGVSKPDTVNMDDLIGYEEQRQRVVENTRRLLAGARANNLLLHGERGTGKSSAIKALIPRFGSEGLRLIELDRTDLHRLPALFDAVGRQSRKFIVFIDDLSFEDSETSYKSLKAAMEGSVEVKPDNVLVYATSNRRHLIKERFEDRETPLADPEIHGGDTLQEKMSLADRFGISILFLAPDQDEYLRIVKAMAEKRGLKIAPDKLRQSALRWAMEQNWRSPRTAKQFVDSLDDSESN